MARLESDQHWVKHTKATTPASTPLLTEFTEGVHGGQYIDVGTGFGRGALELARQGCTVVGVDLNGSELATAQETRLSMGIPSEQVVFVRASGDKLPFPDSTFDGAIMLGLLGGIVGQGAPEIRQDVMADTARTLRRGSPFYASEFAVVTDPNAVDFYGKKWQQVYRDEERLTGEYGSFTVRKPDGSTHFLAHHFTKGELVNGLSRVGIGDFTVKEFMGRSALSGNPSPQIVVWGRKK